MYYKEWLEGLPPNISRHMRMLGFEACKMCIRDRIKIETITSLKNMLTTWLAKHDKSVLIIFSNLADVYKRQGWGRILRERKNTLGYVAKKAALGRFNHLLAFFFLETAFCLG